VRAPHLRTRRIRRPAPPPADGRDGCRRAAP
jgi:hypothetical protein